MNEMETQYFNYRTDLIVRAFRSVKGLESADIVITEPMLTRGASPVVSCNVRFNLRFFYVTVITNQDDSIQINVTPVSQQSVNNVQTAEDIARLPSVFIIKNKGNGQVIYHQHDITTDNVTVSVITSNNGNETKVIKNINGVISCTTGPAIISNVSNHIEMEFYIEGIKYNYIDWVSIASIINPDFDINKANSIIEFYEKRHFPMIY